MLPTRNPEDPFLVAGPTDMRKSFDTLAAVVRNVIRDDLNRPGFSGASVM